jgi:eukaryotic-like serine/threonine-protein kinase
MHLGIGARLGPYEIVSPLGAGGMGEVYRATDTNLKRQVALKVLPAAVAADAERLARFQREAEVLAALNHPHIAQIYGLEKSADVTALVMELIEGEDLAERIARGPLPLDEALPIATQIAEALEAAHEQGIIHRDLKPANIKLRADGTVKVLDFGLAKAMDRSGGSVGPGGSGRSGEDVLLNSPTITSPSRMTGVGVILGTAAYMAPEQARGKAVDRRADIWAFGCVLFEMLTGTRAFDGDDIADVLSRVLQREPDWTLLPAGVPPHLRVLLIRCLHKHVRMRLPHIGVARQELESAPVIEAPATAATARASRWAQAGWGAVGFVTAGILAFSAFAWRQPVANPQAILSSLEVPELAALPGGAFAISPDGQRLAFVAPDSSGQTVLWVRPLASLESQPLRGTEGARALFWSPDSRHIAFTSNGNLKRMEVSGGSPVTLAADVSTSVGTWSRDDVILFTKDRQIFRVSARGGATATTGKALYFPHFLPDGQHYLHLNERNVYVSSVSGGDATLLIENSGNAMYAAGHVLFMRETTLYAQSFDPDRMTLTGEPFPLAERLEINTGSGAGAFSVSDTGALVYQASNTAPSRLVWLDRGGREVSAIGDPARYSSASLSMDDAKVAASIWNESSSDRDIWLIDAQRGVRTRLTTGADDDTDPLLSVDATSVAYASRRGRVKGLYVKNLKDTSVPMKAAEDGFNKSPNAWSADGKRLLFQNMSRSTSFDLWLVTPGAAAAPAVMVQSAGLDQWGEFSPDGRFLAYTSSESGRYEVYLARFPVGAERWPVSTGGGTNVHWRRDGSELFFLSGASLMRVAVRTSPAGVEIGTAEPLFAHHSRSCRQVSRTISTSLPMVSGFSSECR